MRLLLLSRYSHLAASTRLRFLQYLPYIVENGIEVEHEPLLDDEYLKNLYTGKPVNYGSIINSYVRRLKILLKERAYDLIWVQYEIFPWLPAWIESLTTLAGVPYIVDYDDAIFHRYDLHKQYLVRQILGDKINKVMKGASIVVAGNEYIASRALKIGCKKVEIIPTVVDLSRYPNILPQSQPIFTIGWIGTPVTSFYINTIMPALRLVCNENTVRVVLVGSGQISLDEVTPEIRPWSEEREVKDIHSFDVGIMPLAETPWERGKCGFKLIQYMACSKPVVASAVGMNCEIVEHGINGFLAHNMKDWVDALATLHARPDLCHSMGQAGRNKVEAKYSLQVTATRLLELIQEAAKNRGVRKR